MSKTQRTSEVDIARAWKDEAYRESLSPEQRQALPANPAGAIELTEAEAARVSGGCAALQISSEVSSFELTCSCPGRLRLRAATSGG